ncbi:MAG: PDZ domain-containing protein [Clostridia bacterium]|nr:PDZ domain-containing protein [Clostridia bacterium]
MKRRIWKLLCCLLLMLSIPFLGVLTPSASRTQKEFVFAMSHCPSGSGTDLSPETLPCMTALQGAATYSAVLEADADDLRDLMLCPGGMPFGVKFYTDGVMVVGFCDIDTGKGSVNPAARAGLHQKDVILKINGKPLSGAADMTERIEASGGKPLQLTCRRGGKEFEATLTPVLSAAEGRY